MTVFARFHQHSFSYTRTKTCESRQGLQDAPRRIGLFFTEIRANPHESNTNPTSLCLTVKAMALSWHHSGDQLACKPCQKRACNVVAFYQVWLQPIPRLVCSQSTWPFSKILHAAHTDGMSAQALAYTRCLQSLFKIAKGEKV